MADKIMYCTKCEKDTDHTSITEGRLHFCAVCGLETKFAKGEKGPAPRQPKPVPGIHVTIEKQIKPEGKRMAKPKLTMEQIEEIKRRRAAGEKAKALALEYGVNRSVIYAPPRGINPKQAGLPRQGKEAGKTEAGGGFKQALARMVDEQVEKRLAEVLPGKIAEAMEHLLK